jgi:hypothetical protein
MRGLTLAQAVQIADGALAKAREVDCKPMTVATTQYYARYLFVPLRFPSLPSC